LNAPQESQISAELVDPSPILIEHKDVLVWPNGDSRREPKFTWAVACTSERPEHSTGTIQDMHKLSPTVGDENPTFLIDRKPHARTNLHSSPIFTPSDLPESIHPVG